MPRESRKLGELRPHVLGLIRHCQERAKSAAAWRFHELPSFQTNERLPANGNDITERGKTSPRGAPRNLRSP